MVLLRALRSLRRTPVYAITVILTLALGFGSIGAMFAVVHAVLLAPLPYGSPDRLVSVELHAANGDRIALSPSIYILLRRFATTLEDVSLRRTGSVNVWTEDEDVGAEHLSATWMTASTISMLRAEPLLGRGFSDEEERRGGPDAVILSEAEWRARFGGSPDALGRTLVVNNVTREIVGVMPDRFAFPWAGPRMWLPAKYRDDAVAGDFLYAGVARLASGVTLEQSQRELQAILPRLAELFPRTQSGGSTATWLDDARPVLRLRPLREAMTADIAPTLWMLAVIAGLVLLVASANVANLLLVRTEASQQDIAVREALGASRTRASAHMLGESVLLGSAAATLAVLASMGAVFALRQFGPADLPRMSEIGVGPWTACLIASITLLCTAAGSAVLSRIEPSGRLTDRLHDGARGQSVGRSRQRMRASASVLQIATALVVVAASALLLRTVHRLHDLHPGFETDRVTTFRILLPFARFPESARAAWYARLTERVAALPSVHAAGLAAHLPLGAGASPEQAFRVHGGDNLRTMRVNVVSGGYLPTLRIPLLAGRDFRPLASQRPDEIIISQGAAERLFGHEGILEPRIGETHGGEGFVHDVLGRTLRLEPSGPTYTIVGVVGDVRYDDLASPPAAMVYRPQVAATVPGVEPGPLPAMTLTVRSDAPPEALTAAVRGIVRDLDSSVPVFEVRGMQEVVRRSTARLTLTLAVTAAAAGVTLLLGTIGLYGIMAYLVALRAREFGLRMALGADATRIAGSVVGRGLVLTAVGIAVGLAAYAFAAPHLHDAIPGIQAWDPWPVAGAISLLLATATLACWIPALRAAAVDPAQSLRSE